MAFPVQQRESVPLRRIPPTGRNLRPVPSVIEILFSRLGLSLNTERSWRPRCRTTPHAFQISVFAVRAFVRMREQLLHRVEFEKRLANIEKTLMAHKGALRDLYRKNRPLLLPPPPSPPSRPIGFQIREKRKPYRLAVVKPSKASAAHFA